MTLLTGGVCVYTEREERLKNFVGNTKQVLPFAPERFLKHPGVIITGGQRGYDIKTLE